MHLHNEGYINRGLRRSEELQQIERSEELQQIDNFAKKKGVTLILYIFYSDVLYYYRRKVSFQKTMELILYISILLLASYPLNTASEYILICTCII